MPSCRRYLFWSLSGSGTTIRHALLQSTLFVWRNMQHEFVVKEISIEPEDNISSNIWMNNPLYKQRSVDEYTMSHDHMFVYSHATSRSRQMSPLAGWRKSASTLLPSPPVFALPKLPEAAAAHFIDVEKRRKNTDEKFVTWNNGEFRFCLSFATALQLPRQHGELVRRQHRRLARCHPQQGTNAIETSFGWISYTEQNEKMSNLDI